MITFIILFTFYLIGVGLSIGVLYGIDYEDQQFNLGFQKKPLTIKESFKIKDIRSIFIAGILLSLFSWLALIVICIVLRVNEEDIPDLKYSNQDLIDEYNINNHLIHDK